MSEDCLFCRIVDGSVPSTRVHETDHTLAFRDISPAAPVHVLVIPKAHHPDVGALTAADPNLTHELLATIRDVATEQGLDDYRVVFNTGPRAGQSVFHVHGHVLGGRDLGWPPG